MLTLGLVLLAFILGIGYFTGDRQTGELRAECTDSFNRMNTASGDMKLDYGEFYSYGTGASQEDFARADTDKDNALTVQEFCAWTGSAGAPGTTGAPTG